jgi:EF hand
MNIPTRIAFSLLIALVGAGAALPQESKKRSESEEDNRLNRVIERWIDLNESERDHVAREVKRANNGKLDEDFDNWFSCLGGTDEDGWDRGYIKRDSVREIFDRIAARTNHAGPVLGRDQFVGYAKRYWRKDRSPPWHAAPRFDFGAEAERLFKHLDGDRDGYLSSAEIAPSMRTDLKRWDKNRDGWITLDEYRGYFAFRLDQLYGERQQKSESPLPPLEITIPPENEKPQVFRAARLPPGLPAWFTQLDTDKDGQIGLYEWRMAGGDLDEFSKLDLNDDGFLEPNEILRLLAMTERDGSRPFAYLLQKRVTK